MHPNTSLSERDSVISAVAAEEDCILRILEESFDVVLFCFRIASGTGVREWDVEFGCGFEDGGGVRYEGEQ